MIKRRKKKEVKENVKDKSLPLHLKYRPSTFDEFIGNESTIESIRTILARESGEVRSFLLTGQSGCGKTTVARLIGKELNCSEKDFKEYNSANVRGIDTIREISESCKFAPWNGKIKIYLLDEFHKATNDAQNALLKLLEDTPKHVRFILCTTDPEKLLKTIKTRCSAFHFKPLRNSEIMKLLSWICEEEKVEINSEILQKICSYSDGSPRQAVVMLDQIIDIDDDELALQSLIDLTVNEENVLVLCQELLKVSCKWSSISKIISNINEEPEKIRYAVLGYMAKTILDSRNSQRASEIIEVFADSWMYLGKAGLNYSCYVLSQGDK